MISLFVQTLISGYRSEIKPISRVSIIIARQYCLKACLDLGGMKKVGNWAYYVVR